MKISVYTKFAVIYLLAAITAFTFVTCGSSRMILDYLTKQKADLLYEEATSLSKVYARDYYRSRSASSLEEILSQLRMVSAYSGSDIWIMDLNGQVLLESGQNVVQPKKGGHQLKDFDATSLGETYYMTGTFFGGFSEEMLSVISPVSYNYRVRGYIVIHTPMSLLYTEKEELLNIVYITLAVLLLIALAALAVISFLIFYPMKKIIRAASEYSAGNLDYEIELATGDEFGRLAASINYMAHELNEMEEYERKFIANISHDFRSPLTSIKGYVEAMMDGTIPVELQEKYFGIVLFETDRLKKLTEELLMLNSFGTKHGMLDITVFDINPIIKTTAASFEGRCRERRISIELLLNEKQQPVKADIGKIQQVLYNLLDNAVKFSNDDSSITIETTVKYEKVFISVKDHGAGIPYESQKKIWERFYKTDTSRGRDKRGTGLGLAIVKEIIQMHEEHINVISTEGVGTEFIFSLPKA